MTGIKCQLYNMCDFQQGMTQCLEQDLNTDDLTLQTLFFFFPFLFFYTFIYFPFSPFFVIEWMGIKIFFLQT